MNPQAKERLMRAASLALSALKFGLLAFVLVPAYGLVWLLRELVWATTGFDEWVKKALRRSWADVIAKIK